MIAPLLSHVYSTRCWPPVVAYCDGKYESIRALPALVRAGALELVLEGLDDEAVTLRRLLGTIAVQAVASEVGQIATEIVARPLLPAVDYCLHHVTEPRSAEQIAFSLGLSRRTLTQRAEDFGVHGMRAIQSRCKIATALGLLLRANYTVDRAALSLGFSSGVALRNMIKRHTGLKPREAMERGDLRFWARTLFGAPQAAATTNARAS
jgi:AraC-like DNA-binding protein